MVGTSHTPDGGVPTPAASPCCLAPLDEGRCMMCEQPVPAPATPSTGRERETGEFVATPFRKGDEVSFEERGFVRFGKVGAIVANNYHTDYLHASYEVWVDGRSNARHLGARDLTLVRAATPTPSPTPDAGATALRKMLETATVRLEILRDRMEGCDVSTDEERTGHGLSRMEVEHWIAEQREVLATPTPSPTPDAGATALREENARLRAALEEIINPIPAMRARAEAQGAVLNGYAAQIADSTQHLRSIARAALGGAATSTTETSDASQ